MDSKGRYVQGRPIVISVRKLMLAVRVALIRIQRSVVSACVMVAKLRVGANPSLM